MVVDELIRNPERAARGGERRTLSVLFSDLAGFTTLSETLTPEAIVSMLNRYFDEAVNALLRRDANIDKFIGDAIMSFWNAPLPQEDHAARACLAALDLIGVVQSVNGELLRAGMGTLECRIGINTGPCVVGFMGARVSQSYTAIGDSVNLASRLEGAAKVYGTRTLVAWETVRAAGDAVVTRELDLLRVKGRQQPVRVFELLGPKGSPPPPFAISFAEGLRLYRERRFEEALRRFEAAPEDAPSRVFRERCTQFLASPPPANWAGVHTLKSK